MKNEKNAKPSKATKTVASSLNLRNNYTFDELNTMLTAIDKVVSKSKASEEGVDPKDMIKTVRGGRVVWITKGEMNAILAKQRRMVSKRFQQRSIRGEDSLSSEVTRRMEACKRLVKLLRRVQPDRSTALIRRLREIQVVHNRSISLSRDVNMLEEAIQRKKSDDPMLSEMDNTTTEMVSALQRNEIGEVDLCRSFYDKNMEEYAAKQKRLNPYIQKARDCRTALIQCKKDIYLHEFGLLALGDELLTDPVEMMVYYDKEGSFSASMVRCVDDIRKLLSEGKPSFQTLEDYSVEELEKRMEFFQQLDKQYLGPLFEMMVRLLSLFETGFEKFGMKRSAASSTEASARDQSRMAYTQRKRES